MTGDLYETVGIECGTVEQNGKLVETVGIMYPTGIGEECDVRYLTLPGAKALLIDLRDGIAACEAHQAGGSP